MDNNSLIPEGFKDHVDFNTNVEHEYKNKLFNNNNLRSLVRLSGTEPLVRILVEGKNAKLVKQNITNIKNLLRTHLG